MKGKPYASRVDLCVNGSQTKVAKGAFGLKWYLGRNIFYLSYRHSQDVVCNNMSILLWHERCEILFFSVHGEPSTIHNNLLLKLCIGKLGGGHNI